MRSASRSILVICTVSPVRAAGPFCLAIRVQACLSKVAVVASNSRAFLERGSRTDRKSTRLNSSHLGISYAVFFLENIQGAKRKSGGADFLRSLPLVGRRHGGV